MINLNTEICNLKFKYEIKNGDVESEDLEHKELENIVIKPNQYIVKVFETIDLKVK